MQFITIQKILISIFMATLIIGCTSKSKNNHEDVQKKVDEQILLSSEKIQKTQSDLYQAGVINSIPKKLPPVISGKFNAITVNWQGDASQFLEEVAKAEFKKFSTNGVKVPLPININVKNEPLAKVYVLLEAQIGYRAIIIRMPTEIILKYKTIK